MRTIKWLVILIALATAAFAIYAGVAELEPPLSRQEAPAPPPGG